MPQENNTQPESGRSGERQTKREREKRVGEQNETSRGKKVKRAKRKLMQKKRGVFSGTLNLKYSTTIIMKCINQSTKNV